MECFPCVWQGGRFGRGKVPGSSFCLGVRVCEGLPFAWGGTERGSPADRFTLPLLTELAAERPEPALGSLPGTGFLREVPAGKGPFPEPLGQTRSLPGRQQH